MHDNPTAMEDSKMDDDLLEMIFAEEIDYDTIQRLSRLSGQRAEDLVALSQERDPFYVTPGQEQRAREFHALIEQHGFEAVHQRGIFYRFVQLGIFKGAPEKVAKAEYVSLEMAMNCARALGLVPLGAFPENKTRLWLRDGRMGSREADFEKPSIWLPTAARVSRGGFPDFNSLACQPVRILVVIEKTDDDLFREILPVCQRVGAKLVVTGGMSSRGFAELLALEAIEDGRPVLVFWLSDADRAGEHFAVVTGRHLEHIQAQHDIPEIRLDRIALTLEQVKQIETGIGRTIPPAPDVTEGVRYELNALPVFSPGWLRRELSGALEPFTVEVAEPEVEQSEEIEEMLERVERLADRLYQRDAWKLNVLDAYAEEKLAEWDPDVPEVDVPEIDFDGRDWILDPSRDYVSQLNAYRRHGAAHRDRTPLVLTRKLCAYCGEPIPEERDQRSKYCKLAHANAASKARRRGA